MHHDDPRLYAQIHDDDTPLTGRQWFVIILVLLGLLDLVAGILFGLYKLYQLFKP